MKKLLMIFLAVSVLMSMNMSVYASERIYDDVSPNAWYSKTIEIATEAGMVSGVGNNLFKPNDFVTREQAAMILYKRLGNGKVYNNYHFNDVKAGTWYADAIEWMYRSGFTYGVSDSNYGVGEFITRQDLMTLIYRINQEEWETLWDDDQAKYAGRFDINIYQFDDYKEVSDYAFKAMNFATGLNTIYFQHVSISVTPILWGDNHNKLNPVDNCTRAEAVAIIQRSWDRIIY